MLLETRNKNTWQNAQFTASFFEHRRFDRALLVTSGVHLRRTLLYFVHFGIEPTPTRSDYGRPITAAVPMAYSFLLTDVSLHELSLHCAATKPFIALHATRPA